MRKGILLIGLFLFFSFLGIARADSPSKCLFFRVSWNNGDYNIDSLSVVMDYPLGVDENGNYLVKLRDKDGTTLYQHKTKRFSMELEPSALVSAGEIGEERMEIDHDELFGTKQGQMFFILPYTERAQTLSFEHGENVLTRVDLGVLCNENGVCEEEENYLSCPTDCPLEKKDNYCLARVDKVCDLDCAEGIDLDCEKESETSEGEREGFSEFVWIQAIVLIVGILIAFGLYKKLKG